MLNFNSLENVLGLASQPNFARYAKNISHVKLFSLTKFMMASDP